MKDASIFDAYLLKKFKAWKGLTSVILVNLPPGLLKPPLSPALLWGNKWRNEGVSLLQPLPRLEQSGLIEGVIKTF